MTAPNPWTSERSRNGGIDRVPVPGVDGELWLCGKHFIGPDHDHARRRVDAVRVYCLNEAHELADRYPDYLEWVRSGDGAAAWYPIPDLTAPPVAVAETIVVAVLDDLASGANVVVHCGAGIGRAGTIAAAVLVRLGSTPDEAVAVVAASRPMAGPEAGAQTALLHELHQRWG